MHRDQLTGSSAMPAIIEVRGVLPALTGNPGRAAPLFTKAMTAISEETALLVKNGRGSPGPLRFGSA